MLLLLLLFSYLLLFFAWFSSFRHCWCCWHKCWCFFWCSSYWYCCCCWSCFLSWSVFDVVVVFVVALSCCYCCRFVIKYIYPSIPYWTDLNKVKIKATKNKSLCLLHYVCNRVLSVVCRHFFLFLLLSPSLWSLSSSVFVRLAVTVLEILTKRSLHRIECPGPGCLWQVLEKTVKEWYS